MIKNSGVLLMMIVFTLSLLTGCSVSTRAVADHDRSEALLIERATEVWTAVVNKDRGTWYDYYDPFFRARITREWWIGNATNMTHHSFEIKGVEVNGNIGKVHVKVLYSAKYMSQHFGKMLGVDNKEAALTETWLFIDGNWYRQFIDGISGGTFAHY